jgi:hypothetical protein
MEKLKCGTYNADANTSMNLAKRLRQLLNEPKAMTGSVLKWTCVPLGKVKPACLSKPKSNQGMGNR